MPDPQCLPERPRHTSRRAAAQSLPEPARRPSRSAAAQVPAPDRTVVPPDNALPSGALAILRRGAASGRLTHIERLPARAGVRAAWPGWIPPELVAAFNRVGVAEPWTHQAAAADLARAGRNVILATGTASGKSVGYLAPALTAIGEGATALYLAPTRALAADQLNLLHAIGGTAERGLGLRPVVVDSDTPHHQRAWARRYATYLLTTPDMLHYGLLPQHERWSGFLRRLRYVIVDECHGYSGVFGSHVAHVLRRLRRVAAHHAEPGSPGLVFVFASATISEPSKAAELLTGLPAEAVTADAAPRGAVTFALWEPPLTTMRGDANAPLRRGIVAETADMLAELVRAGVPALAFIRSRRGAEAAAAAARSRLTEAGVPELAERVAAYRSGYLPQERRALEEALRAGAITAMAATPALELGINITGLDAVIIAGWPGTRAALWQQAGRAGRAGDDGAAGTQDPGGGRGGPGREARDGQGGGPGREARDGRGGEPGRETPDGRGGEPGREARDVREGRASREAIAVLIARDDPLDTYLVHHPQALLHRPVEATVLDPANPYILAPHLCAAAAEIPLTGADVNLFGPAAGPLIADLVSQGTLRDRGGRWHPTGRRVPLTGLRGTGGRPLRIVEETTGRLIGTMDEPSGHVFLHEGAVYSHQGDLHLVVSLDLADGVALVQPGDPGYVTSARELTDIGVGAEHRRCDWGDAAVVFGDVLVTRQVVSFTRRKPETGQPISEHLLDLPSRTLRTRAVWWTVSPAQRDSLAEAGTDLAGAAHAAEHAAIGLLPLVAACDRWDVGGVSADLHHQTGRLTVFVYDGHDGGAGFAERGFAAAAPWLRATALAIADCECTAGCPSCIQSPKCGSGNEPLSKAGSLALLGQVLRGAPD
jgi:DEAD/DEAH box helicase domain-containing protein